MSEKLTTEMLSQMQDEITSLVTAWSDRGIAPDESALVLAGTTHMMLAQSGFSLGQIVTLLSNGWQKSNGKL